MLMFLILFLVLFEFLVCDFDEAKFVEKSFVHAFVELLIVL